MRLSVGSRVCAANAHGVPASWPSGAAARRQRGSLGPRFPRRLWADDALQNAVPAAGPLGAAPAFTAEAHQGRMGGAWASETGEDAKGLGGNPLFRQQSPLPRLVALSRESWQR